MSPKGTRFMTYVLLSDSRPSNLEDFFVTGSCKKPEMASSTVQNRGGGLPKDSMMEFNVGMG